jgi:serine/threonine protein kinase
VSDIAAHFSQLEVLELIGHGGMGAVYKARQPALDRVVALKVLPPAWGQDPAFAERFTREARALARLNHSNIVIVYDFGQVDGLFYFVMEYVDGGNLRQRLRGHPMPALQTTQLLSQVCDALHFAHEEGVVHRDIKPENLLLASRRSALEQRLAATAAYQPGATGPEPIVVKIADFGLAKLVTRSGGDLTLTAPHQIMGTLHYMAPEQMERPREVDHRADIYSLGVLCYELLTGELPIGRFELPSEKARVDVRFDALVEQALAKEPAKRFQRVSEFRARLEAIATSYKTPPPMVLPVDAVPVPQVAPLAALATPNRPAEVNLPLAVQLVRGPSTGLLVTGILNLVAFLMIVSGQVASLWSELQIHMNWSAKALGFPVLGAAILMLLGSARMRRLESLTLVKISSIVAMIPLPCCVVGLPVGVWSLLTLKRPEVRSAFEARSPHQRSL